MLLLENSNFERANRASLSTTGATIYFGKGVYDEITGCTIMKEKNETELQPKKNTNKQTKTQLQQKKKGKYQINKQLVKSKMESWARVVKPKSFFAFYSISFPCGFKDTDAMKVLNIWLTRIRKFKKCVNYIWVSERQKNGTVHYHVLIDKFLNIRLLNHYAAKSIDNVMKSNGLNGMNWNYKKYNGVDVQRVMNLKGLKKYMTKYVTKSYESFNTLANGMSLMISKLGTKIRVHTRDLEMYVDYFKDWFSGKWEKNVRVLSNYAMFIPWENSLPPDYRKKIDMYNMLIVSKM